MSNLMCRRHHIVPNWIYRWIGLRNSYPISKVQQSKVWLCQRIKHNWVSLVHHSECTHCYFSATVKPWRKDVRSHFLFIPTVLLCLLNPLISIQGVSIEINGWIICTCFVMWINNIWALYYPTQRTRPFCANYCSSRAVQAKHGKLCSAVSLQFFLIYRDAGSVFELGGQSSRQVPKTT